MSFLKKEFTKKTTVGKELIKTGGISLIISLIISSCLSFVVTHSTYYIRGLQLLENHHFNKLELTGNFVLYLLPPALFIVGLITTISMGCNGVFKKSKTGLISLLIVLLILACITIKMWSI